MKNKKSLVLLVVLSFVGIFAIYDIYYYSNRVNSSHRARLRNKVEWLKVYAGISDMFLKNRQLEELHRVLEEGRYRRLISFFILKKSGEVVFFGNEKSLEAINEDYQEPGKIFYFPGEVYVSVAKGNYFLTIGTHHDPSEHFYGLLEEELPLIIKEIIMVAGIVFLILVYYFRDFLKILFAMKRQKKRDFGMIRSSTYESDLFIKGLKGYEKNIMNLQERMEALRGQVLPALQSEMLSGQKPPYEFSCTMVLTDINNYSEIYDTQSKEKFIAIMKEFIFGMAHIISRHGGLVYKFVGDEVIYYFKDKDHRNSSAVALACVCEVNHLIEFINRKYSGEVSYRVYIKSALACGTVLLDSLIDTFELFGTGIIEASRILATISSKNENTVYYGDAIKEKVNFLCESKKESVCLLKGIKGERRLYSMVRRKPLDDILCSLTDYSCFSLYYYRSDRDIVEILTFLKEVSDTLDERLYLNVTNVLKDYSVSKTPPGAKKAFLEVLECVSEKYRQTGKKRYLYFLSSVIMATTHLISPDSFDEAFEELFKSYLDFDNRRVIANAVDVFVHFGITADDSVFAPLLKNQNNRILANALIREGLRELNSAILNEIKKMMRSGNPYFVASGCYALGELAAHYRKQDLVYYNTNVSLVRLVAGLKDLVEHENEMVRRQALLAAGRINDEALEEAIRAIYAAAISKVVKSDIEKFFLSHRMEESEQAA